MKVSSATKSSLTAGRNSVGNLRLQNFSCCYLASANVGAQSAKIASCACARAQRVGLHNGARVVRAGDYPNKPCTIQPINTSAPATPKKAQTRTTIERPDWLL